MIRLIKLAPQIYFLNFLLDNYNGVLSLTLFGVSAFEYRSFLGIHADRSV